MYKKHRVMLVLVILLFGAISYLFSVDYADIASDGITVVSIILAIYMTSFSGLVSSDLAKAVSRRNCSGMTVLFFLSDGFSDVLPLMPITAWSASVWNGLKRQSSNPAVFNSLVILLSWAVMAISRSRME